MPFNKPILLGKPDESGRKLEILSGLVNAEGFKRADQPQPLGIAPAAAAPAESNQSDTNTAAGAPSAPPPIDPELTGSPEAQAQAAAKEARAAAQQPAAQLDEIIVNAPRPAATPKTGDDPLPQIYGPRATFATSTGKEKSFIGGLLGDIADNALSAAIHGGSIKDAVVNTAIGGTLQGIVGAVVPAIRGKKTQPSTEDNTASGSTAEKPPTTPGDTNVI